MESLKKEITLFMRRIATRLKIAWLPPVKVYDKVVKRYAESEWSTPTLDNISSVLHVHERVNAGGFLLYYHENNDFLVGFATPAFEMLGEEGLADVMRRADERYLDMQRRWGRGWSDEPPATLRAKYGEALFDDLDREFFSLIGSEEQLHATLGTYAKRHPADFLPTHDTDKPLNLDFLRRGF